MTKTTSYVLEHELEGALQKWFQAVNQFEPQLNLQDFLVDTLSWLLQQSIKKTYLAQRFLNAKSLQGKALWQSGPQ